MAGHLKFAAISIFAAALLAAACFGGDDVKAPDDPGLLLAPGRTHLSLCVDSAGGRQAADADVDFVQTSIEQAFAVADNIPSEYGVATTETGCPPPLELSGARITDVDRMRSEAFLDDAALVSPHLVFVYLVPSEDFVAAFGIAAFENSGYDFRTAEWLCSGRRVTPIASLGGFRDGPGCESMTFSVYVPEDVSREDLADVFLDTLGLRTRQPAPTIDWQVCVSGSDAPYCEVYQVCIPPTHTGPEFCEEFWDRTGQTRPPPIDTSAWPTFSSPLGFDIKYPSGWTVAQSEPSDFPLQRARIHNELAWKNYEPRIGTLGRGYLPESGEAWFHISPDPLPYFDVRGLISICGTEEQREGGSSRAHETTVDGHRAIRCLQSGPSLAADIVSDSNILWIEEPPGRAIHVAYTVHGGDPDIIAAANAALATITFRE